MMEKAIFITEVDSLSLVAKKYSRLYFGIEFCQRLIPSANDLKKAYSFAIKNNLSFTFVSPYVTGVGLQKLDRLFKLMEDKFNNVEVVFNDWGVFELLREKYPNFQRVIGRLLTRQKRDPRILRMVDDRWRSAVTIRQDDGSRVLILPKKLPEPMLDFYKETVCNVPRFQEFLIEILVYRAEFDNLLQGINLSLKNESTLKTLPHATCLRQP